MVRAQSRGLRAADAVGPSKALYLRDYYDWFALPDRLTADNYLKAGVGPLLQEKVTQTGRSLWSLYASYYDPTLAPVPGSVFGSLGSLLEWCGDPRTGPVGSDPQPWVFLRHLSLVMAPLTFLGLGGLLLSGKRRGHGYRWVSVYGLHAGFEIVFYAWLFTGVANQSYVSSLYSLYPLFCVGLAASLDPARMLALGGAGVARASSWLGWGLTVFFCWETPPGSPRTCAPTRGPSTSNTTNTTGASGARCATTDSTPRRIA